MASITVKEMPSGCKTGNVDRGAPKVGCAAAAPSQIKI